MSDSSDLVDRLMNPFQQTAAHQPGPAEGSASDIVDLLMPGAGRNEDPMYSARLRHAGRQEPNIGVVVRHGIPFMSAGIRVVESALYQSAKSRIAAGNGRPDDYDTVARREAEEQSARHAGLGRDVGVAIASLPAVAGEALVGGAAVSSLSPTLAAAPQLLSGGAFASRTAFGLAAGRTAALTATMPSMWSPQWTEDNIRNGRDAMDPRGLPAAVTMGFMNTAVLGSLGNFGNSITGRGVLPVARRLITRTATGMLEQQGVDVLASAISEVLPEAYRLQTGYGLAGHLATKGADKDFWKHAFTQAVTFAAFSALHEVQTPHEAVQAIKETIDQAHEQKMTSPQAAEYLQQESARRLQEALDSTEPRPTNEVRRPPFDTEHMPAQGPEPGIDRTVGLPSLPEAGSPTIAPTAQGGQIATEQASSGRTGQNQGVPRPFEGLATEQLREIAKASGVDLGKRKPTPERLVAEMKKLGINEEYIAKIDEAYRGSGPVDKPPTMEAPVQETLAPDPREAELAKLIGEQSADAGSQTVPKERTSGAGEIPEEHARAIEESRLSPQEKVALTEALSGASYQEIADSIGTKKGTAGNRALKAFEKLKRENPELLPGIDSIPDFLQELKLQQLERMATAPGRGAEPSAGPESILEQLAAAEETAGQFQQQVEAEHGQAQRQGKNQGRSKERIRADVEEAVREALAVAARQRGGSVPESTPAPNQPGEASPGAAPLDPGVYHASGPGSTSAPTAGNLPGTVGPHDIVQFITQSSEVPTYTGKVPGGAKAAAVIPTKQTIVESGSKADVKIKIEEMSHHDVVNRMETDPAKLPADVARGMVDFFKPGAPLTERNIVEGFGQWAVKRTEGKLKNLTPEQQAANQFAEAFLGQSKLAGRYDQIRDMYGRWQGTSELGQAQSLISATGKGPDQTAGTKIENAYDLLVNWRGPAKRMDAEVNALRARQGLKPLDPGHSLETTIARTNFMASEWANQFADHGLFEFVKDASGERYQRQISGPMSDIYKGFAPADLQPLTAKREGLAISEKASRADTFILARSVVSEVDLGTRMLAKEIGLPEKARDQSIIEEAKRKIDTAPHDQVEAFRKYVESERINDPAFFQTGEEAAKEYTERSNQGLDVLVSVGKMTQAQKNAWEAAHPDYVPFMRVMDTGKADAKIGPERHGSARPFVAPSESMRMRELRIAADVVSQLTFESLYESGKFPGTAEVGVSKFWREIKEPNKPVISKIERETLDRQLEVLGYDQMQRDLMINSMGKDALEMNKPWRDSDKNIYRGMYEGKPVTLEILNRPLYELLTTKEGTANPIVKAFADLAGLRGARDVVTGLKWAATTGNMAFQARNLPHDVPTYFSNTKSDFLAATADLLKGYGSAYSGKFQELFGMKPSDPFWRMYEQGGAEMMRSQSHNGHSAVKWIEKGNQLLELLGAGEHGPRFAEYKRALQDMGFTEAKISDSLAADPNTSPIPLSAQFNALQRAAEVTTDYAATGSWVKQYNKIDPFFGAHIASMTQQAANFYKSPAKMAGILGVYMAAEIAHNYLYKDEQWYNELADHQRHNWFVLFKDKNDQVWGVPKPQGVIRMVGAFAQEILRTMTDKDPRFSMAAGTAYQSAVPRVLPIGAGEAWNLGTNQSWSGQPIVPRHAENQEQFDQWLKYRLPYLAEQLTGGLANPRQAMRAWQSDEGSWAERSGLGILRSPLQGVRVSQTAPHQSVQDFYELQAALQREHSRASQAGDRSDREYEYRTLTRAKERMDRLSAELRGMRTNRRGGRVEDEMPSEARQREIRADMLELAQDALSRIR